MHSIFEALGEPSFLASPPSRGRLRLDASIEGATRICRRALDLANVPYSEPGGHRFVCLCNRRAMDGGINIEIILVSRPGEQTDVEVKAEGKRKEPLRHLFALRYVEYIRGLIEKLSTWSDAATELADENMLAEPDATSVEEEEPPINDPWAIPEVLGLPGQEKTPAWPVRVIKEPAGHGLRALLIAARWLTEEQFEEARRRALENKLSIGRVLVLMGLIKQTQLMNAAETLRLMQQGRISLGEAVRRLQTESSPHGSAYFAGTKRRQQVNRLRLGELLTEAGALTESDLSAALEVGMEDQTAVGETLLRMGLISGKTLETALNLQMKVGKSELRRDIAIRTLKEQHP